MLGWQMSAGHEPWTRHLARHFTYIICLDPPEEPPWGAGHYFPIAAEEIEGGKLGDLTKVAKKGSSPHSGVLASPCLLPSPPPPPCLQGTGGGGGRAAGAS